VVFVGDKGKICVDRGRFMAEPESSGRWTWRNCRCNSTGARIIIATSPSASAAAAVPVCDVEIGARSVTVCHLGNLAYWHQRALEWDPKTERFEGDAEANDWLDNPKRDPWKT
jgi:hypothetical protein